VRSFADPGQMHIGGAPDPLGGLSTTSCRCSTDTVASVAQVDVFTVFLAAAATAVATGLGALPLLVVRDATRAVLGAANAAAAGVMLAASVGLVWKGGSVGGGRVVAGALMGAGFIVLARRYLSNDHQVTIGSLRGEDAVKGVLIVAVMTVHSAAEGIAVGASFGGGATLGVLITIAIAVHNIPEGLAISLVLVPRGVSVPRAAWWSIFSSLPQPLLAVPAFLFVEAVDPLQPVALGFAAGAMIWMAGRELVPEAFAQAPRYVVWLVGLCAFGAMAVFQALLL
jgi:zinc transporter ZupT